MSPPFALIPSSLPWLLGLTPRLGKGVKHMHQLISNKCLSMVMYPCASYVGGPFSLHEAPIGVAVTAITFVPLGFVVH